MIFFEFFHKVYTDNGKLCCKSNITFESKLEIIISNMKGFCFPLQTTPCCFSPNFVQFPKEYKILIWVKECFRSPLGREKYSKIGHIRDTETNVSNSLLALSL